MSAIMADTGSDINHFLALTGSASGASLPTIEEPEQERRGPLYSGYGIKLEPWIVLNSWPLRRLTPQEESIFQEALLDSVKIRKVLRRE